MGSGASAMAVVAFACASSGCVPFECPTPSTIDHAAEDHVSLKSGVYGLVYEPGGKDSDGCETGEHVWRLTRMWLADVATMDEITSDHSDLYGAYELTPPAAGMYQLCIDDDGCLPVTLTADACLRVDASDHQANGGDVIALLLRDDGRCP